MELVAWIILLFPANIPEQYLTSATLESIHQLAKEKFLYNSEQEVDSEENSYYSYSVYELKDMAWEYLLLPPLSDANRFRFDSKNYWEQWNFAKKFITFCENNTQLEPYREKDWRFLIEQTEIRLVIWDTAQNLTWGGDLHRRRNLRKLLDLLEDSFYYSGRLPAIVPVEYFRRIDD